MFSSTIMYPLLSAVVLCVLLHTFVIALCAAAFGIKVREVSIGLGPTAFSIGRLTLRALSFGSSVRFKDSREEELDESDMHDAFDGRSALVQMLIGLSGCIALVALSAAIWQSEAIRLVLDGFVQILWGAASPRVKAQAFLAQAEQVLAGLPFLAVLGLVAAKLAAFNLLPLPAANGGFVLATLGRVFGIAQQWPEKLTSGLLLVYFAIALSWLAALVMYLLR
ncbi:site-2 protease family protein [Pigmentiphaga aceris]|uniref:site-2 protease family protein n=1 Tax=Pigmentiphaga aceris TaxID=1940612 RepID=UPI001651D331|nr:site-2 protease family protein [Pigmentiphaga aceris]